MKIVISFVSLCLAGIRLCTTGNLGEFRHSHLIPRSRLRRGPDIEHGFSDRSLPQQTVGCYSISDPVPGSLSPLYRGELLVHGLGYSPDTKTLAVVSVGSNSVTLIDTATNRVKGEIYVGRSPHEAFFSKEGRELWVTVRGEDYVSVFDPALMKEARRIKLANGPGMTMFSPDGRYGFVCSSFTPELAVVEVASHQVVSRLPQAAGEFFLPKHCCQSGE